MLLKAAASLVGAALLVAVAGCGGAEGVADGATVTAYVVQPLCAEAERELAGENGRAGELRVKAVCLPKVESGGRLHLGTIGANARRATEDATAVAFLEAPGAGNDFSAPVLETAEVPAIYERSGRAAMASLLKAVDRSDTSGSLRSSLADELE